MSTKLFHLIYGDKINLAPNCKIIPQEAYSRLLDAEEILAKIKQEAEKYRLEVASECEELKEQAQSEGFEAGFRKWTEQIVYLENEIAKVHQEVQKLVIPIALKAAKKIVGREIEVSETAVVDIIANVLKAVAQHKKIVIYASKKDLEALEIHKNRLKQIFENLESFSLREREDIEQGGCIIETEGGIINAQLSQQWNILEQAFESYMKQLI